MKERDFELSELYFLQSELKISIERLIERGFFSKDCMDYDWVHYKLLVRHYKKIQALILDTLDTFDEMYCDIYGTEDVPDDDC